MAGSPAYTSAPAGVSGSGGSGSNWGQSGSFGGPPPHNSDYTTTTITLAIPLPLDSNNSNLDPSQTAYIAGQNNNTGIALNARSGFAGAVALAGIVVGAALV